MRRGGAAMDGELIVPRFQPTSQKDRTRLKILEAFRKDVGDFSVAEICRAAGVSRKSFYACFSSKHDIINWWSQYCEPFFLDEIGRTLDPLTGYRGHFRILFKDFGVVRAYTEQYGCIPFGKNEIASRRNKTLTSTLEDYRHLHVDERLRFSVETFSKLESSVAAEWALSPGRDVDELAQHMVDIIPPNLMRALGFEP